MKGGFPVQKFLEDKLHIKVTITPFHGQDGLPLYLKGLYQYEVGSIAGSNFLLATPLETLNLSQLRKHHHQLMQRTHLNVVFCFETLGPYTKEKLVEEGISFLIKDKEIYIPFAGILLSTPKRGISTPLAPTEKLSFQAQRFILQALEERWNSMTVGKTARAMGVSAMTITRTFNELDGLGLGLIHRQGRTRIYEPYGHTRELWERLQPHLRNPAKRIYRLEQPLSTKGHRLGGLSALCHYTMLADSSYQTFAMTLAQAQKAGIKELPCVPKGEEPAAVVQIVAYGFGNADAMDPLSTILSITESEKEYPRVEQAIRKLLEDTFHDNRA